jgi:ubiquinone/menaquinone biosynthesis C-methylase UbiE
MELAMMGRFRRRLISEVSGPRVLEVGVGTGKNLAYYAPDLRVDAIDFSPRMLARARRRPQRAGVQLHAMDVQQLQFEDGAFDTVVSTCVLCSVPDPVRGLQEIRRVLRPGGRGLFLEHVRPGHPWLGKFFDWLDPIVSKAGPHVNRRTVDNVRAAGLAIEGEENLLWDIVKLIVARP